MKHLTFLLVLLFSLPTLAYAQDATIQGKVVEQGSENAVSFVNIGIIDKQIGTVSDVEGNFSLTISDSLTSEKLTFSAIGFKPLHLDIQNLIDSKEQTIHLSPQIYNLDQVTVSVSKLKEQTIGIKWNGLVKVAGMIEDDNLGFEFALGMKCKRYPCLIKKVDVEIHENKLNPSLFRLNIYESEQNKPAQNILQNPILVESELESGTLKIPLEKDSIQVNKDFFVSLEWIQDTSADTTRRLYLRGRLIGKKHTWVRKTSQDSWRKEDRLNIVMSAKVLN